MLLARYLITLYISALFVTSHAADLLQIILADPNSVTAQTVAKWKEQDFTAVAVLLDEKTPASVYQNSAKHISEAGLQTYYWIEVARNPEMAAKHPRWMASLGAHPDWQKNFPNAPEPGINQVAKAYPWVPISYSETYEAHLARIEQLLKHVPPGWQGLLLNDLQGGPSSCGCGNILCRWAVDYHVASTATKLKDPAVAARFLVDVKKHTAGKEVIPIWTTECSDVDMPPDKNNGKPGTGKCGTVGCATGACPLSFTDQFMALVAGYNGSIGLLALHHALEREDERFGGGPTWFENTFPYVNKTLSANDGRPVLPERLWLVVEDVPSLKSLREQAAKLGAGAVIVSQIKIDQSYEPKIIRTE